MATNTPSFFATLLADRLLGLTKVSLEEIRDTYYIEGYKKLGACMTCLDWLSQNILMGCLKM